MEEIGRRGQVGGSWFLALGLGSGFVSGWSSSDEVSGACWKYCWHICRNQTQNMFGQKKDISSCVLPLFLFSALSKEQAAIRFRRGSGSSPILIWSLLNMLVPVWGTQDEKGRLAIVTPKGTILDSQHACPFLGHPR